MATSARHSFEPLPTSDNVEAGIQGPVSSNMEEVLDGLLSKVGYGLFQKKLLILCGFGWLADNMWLQTIAIILPRVQEHYDVPDKWIGTLSSSIFTGMTFGAFFWGSFSDNKGRKIPYTMTLLITTIFGALSSFAFNFASLCVCLFFLGFGVGGNMPTDGALYLEFLPKEYHYLLTFMSVFFSFGAVFASILGYMILPTWSCPETMPCDVATQNYGWRIMLFSVAIVTFIMLLLRSVWIKLPETPKFLMSQNRANETITVLNTIARINNNNVDISKYDLPDRLPSPTNLGEYNEMESDLDRDREEEQPRHHEENSPMLNTEEEEEGLILEEKIKSWELLFSPKWRLTTVLICSIWTVIALAYTMFNVFLPKYLETLGFEGESVPTRKDVYFDYMIYSLASVPGSIIASFMIETRLGRKGTMALSAFGSAGSLLLFSIINSRLTMLLSSSSVSFLATLLYAVIYGYTPEVFDTNVRGTAVGLASGLGRISGIAAPIISGVLLTISTSTPLYVSVVGFTIVGICVMLLPYETRRFTSSSSTTIIHA